MTETWLPWHEAWEAALYGAQGFYRANQPADHFRTSAHTSPFFAAAILELARRIGATGIVDYAAGSGELLGHLRQLHPEIDLMGIELRDRPAALPENIEWSTVEPAELTGLVVANEWLDNVPCAVVEVDGIGVPRLVEVCLATGEERLADPVSGASLTWLEHWWPLDRPGERAEVGLSRDRAWHRLCHVVQTGMLVAVDYSHTKGTRPPLGSLTGYRSGVEVPPRPDGSTDITAHVAIDSILATSGPATTQTTQRDALSELGIDAVRPPRSLAESDPPAYLRRLSQAAEAAELMRSPGLGDFSWAMCPR